MERAGAEECLFQKQDLAVKRFVAALGEQGEVARRLLRKGDGGPSEQGFAGGAGLAAFVGATDLIDGLGQRVLWRYGSMGVRTALGAVRGSRSPAATYPGRYDEQPSCSQTQGDP